MCHCSEPASPTPCGGYLWVRSCLGGWCGCGVMWFVWCFVLVEWFCSDYDGKWFGVVESGDLKWLRSELEA